MSLCKKKFFHQQGILNEYACFVNWGLYKRMEQKQGDLKLFGTLMNLSHQSLKELYEVSGAELDTIAEYSRFYKGVLGSRMTGAGFGGCAIALVKTDFFDDYSRDLCEY